MIRTCAAIALALTTSAAAGARPEPFHLIPGAVPMDKGPDGNTVIFEAPKGLVVFDTGRHPEHAQAILDYAKRRHRPIAAIVNSHWHLDHTTGNWDVRRAYPRVAVCASNALEGALATYLKQGREQGDKMLADPKTPAAQKAELLRGRAVVDHPERIRPDHVISRSKRMQIAGRWFDVHLSRFAATEGDVWLYDRKSRTAVVGDLVVGIVPFADTACVEGWAKALNEVDRVPFVTLVPGHGEPMTRADFGQWKRAYDKLLDCTRSKADKTVCIAGWQKDAARFIDAAHRDYVTGALDYYIDRRFRAPDEQARYCKPLGA
jgi:glyoxylase-like metal-dependent hydrolase (beta-lactamase superfamily II)